ncbi:MAG TPA: hypothetical protein VMZ30_05990 [Pyrinomonadaceae bacterium]|nr:hypothetical protein [Pyrinomonadaceae bacterium]
MQRLILLFVTILSLPVPAIHGSQASNTAATQFADGAIIQRRRIVLIRNPGLVRRFPHKKRAVVTYPVVSGLSSEVLRRVRAILDFKNIFDYSLKEYREDTWLDEFDYVVNHNGNSLLDITFSQSGSAAYPDDQSKHFLIDLRNGKVIKAADVFLTERLAPLATSVNQKLQAELKTILQELSESKSDAEDIRIAREAQEPLRFTLEDLDNFSVGRKGITFLYDAGYPHVIQAFEPVGRYFFSYSELKPYIKPDGPLGQFLH